MAQNNLKVKSVRLDAKNRRGLTLILRILVDDFDNGFDKLFPNVSDSQIMDICSAIEWLEQYAHDIYE